MNIANLLFSEEAADRRRLKAAPLACDQVIEDEEEGERSNRLVSSGFGWYCDMKDLKEDDCCSAVPTAPNSLDGSSEAAESDDGGDRSRNNSNASQCDDEDCGEWRSSRQRSFSLNHFKPQKDHEPAQALLPVSSDPVIAEEKDAAHHWEKQWEKANGWSNQSTKTFQLPANSVIANKIVKALHLAIDPSPHGMVSIPVMVYISGYRVVKQGFKRHCEYGVVLSCRGRKQLSWRRFSEFKLLASTCCEYRQPGACKAWGAVKQRQRFGRCLQQDYLGKKCTYLENFLRMFMFDHADPSLLVAFLL
ncbi:unnamed protein product [Chrysoparadoxa australica]